MNALFELTESWLALFVIHMLEISIFVLLVLLADKFITSGVKGRYFIWVLALIKLLVPPLFSLPQAIQAQIQGQIPLLQIKADVVATVEPNPSLPLSMILFALWLFSASLVALFVAQKNISLRYRLQKSKPINISGFSDKMPAFESDSIKSPILLGLWRPQVYLPLDWRTWPEKQLRSILAHETAHVKHRDIFVLSAQYMGLIFFWMNPLVWIVHLRLNQLRELRCDEFAMHRTGVSPIAYSKMIIKFLEAGSSTPMLVGKCFSKNTRTIFVRINYLLNSQEASMKTKSVLKYGLPAALALLIFVLSWRCSDTPVESVKEQGALQKTMAFQPYDEAPTPIGGFKAIQENMKYPEIARLAGIEGRVIVQALISEEGKLIDSRISQSLGHSGCDEAALNALKGIDWQPAQYKGKPVKVWIAIPVLFKLNKYGKREVPPTAPKVYDFSSRSHNSVKEQGALQKGMVFQPYDKAPTPIGGYKAIQKNLKYPEIARRAGIEGRVIVQVLISEEGRLIDSNIFESLGNNGCDEAALDALKAINWQPAQYKGKPVRVWVSVPVLFKLGQDARSEAPPTAPKVYEVSNRYAKPSEFDEPPKPVGGFGTFFQNLKYLEIARKAGIEGRVVAQILISEKGKVLDSKILESLGQNGCD